MPQADELKTRGESSTQPSKRRWHKPYGGLAERHVPSKVPGTVGRPVGGNRRPILSSLSRWHEPKHQGWSCCLLQGLSGIAVAHQKSPQCTSELFSCLELPVRATGTSSRAVSHPPKAAWIGSYRRSSTAQVDGQGIIWLGRSPLGVCCRKNQTTTIFKGKLSSKSLQIVKDYGGSKTLRN